MNKFTSLLTAAIGVGLLAAMAWSYGGSVSGTPTQSNPQSGALPAANTLLKANGSGGTSGSSATESNGIMSDTGFAAADTSSGRFHAPMLSTTTIKTLVPNAVGDLILATGSGKVGTQDIFALCVASGTNAGAVVLSTKPAQACLTSF